MPPGTAAAGAAAAGAAAAGAGSSSKSSSSSYASSSAKASSSAVAGPAQWRIAAPAANGAPCSETESIPGVAIGSSLRGRRVSCTDAVLSGMTMPSGAGAAGNSLDHANTGLFELLDLVGIV